MRKVLIPLCLLLLVGGLLLLARQIQNSASAPPPYREAVRESRPTLPLLRPSALVRAEISLRASGRGESPLARALLQGMHLRIQGAVAPRYSDLAFSLRSGTGLSRWREIEAAGKRVLVVGGIPYRSSSSFLNNDWAKAMQPGHLLRLWRQDLPRRAVPLPPEEKHWAYRTPRPLSGWVSLQDILGPGSTDLLFLRSSGAPGGLRYQTRTTKTARLLGVSPTLLAGIKDVRWQISYQVLGWKVPRAPVLPTRLYPRGQAALQTALLPFYTGLAQ